MRRWSGRCRRWSGSRRTARRRRSDRTHAPTSPRPRGRTRTPPCPPRRGSCGRTAHRPRDVSARRQRGRHRVLEDAGDELRPNHVYVFGRPTCTERTRAPVIGVSGADMVDLQDGPAPRGTAATTGTSPIVGPAEDPSEDSTRRTAPVCRPGRFVGADTGDATTHRTAVRRPTHDAVRRRPPPSVSDPRGALPPPSPSRTGRGRPGRGHQRLRYRADRSSTDDDSAQGRSGAAGETLFVFVASGVPTNFNPSAPHRPGPRRAVRASSSTRLMRFNLLDGTLQPDWPRSCRSPSRASWCCRCRTAPRGVTAPT